MDGSSEVTAFVVGAELEVEADMVGRRDSLVERGRGREGFWVRNGREMIGLGIWSSARQPRLALGRANRPP